MAKNLNLFQGKKVKVFDHPFPKAMQAYKKNMTSREFGEYLSELRDSQVNWIYEYLEGTKIPSEGEIEQWVSIAFGSAITGPGREIYQHGLNYIETLTDLHRESIEERNREIEARRAIRQKEKEAAMAVHEKDHEEPNEEQFTELMSAFVEGIGKEALINVSAILEKDERYQRCLQADRLKQLDKTYMNKMKTRLTLLDELSNGKDSSDNEMTAREKLHYIISAVVSAVSKDQESLLTDFTKNTVDNNALMEQISPLREYAKQYIRIPDRRQMSASEIETQQEERVIVKAIRKALSTCSNINSKSKIYINEVSSELFQAFGEMLRLEVQKSLAEAATQSSDIPRSIGMDNAKTQSQGPDDHKRAVGDGA